MKNEKFFGSSERPRNFKFLGAFGDTVIEFKEDEENKFKKLWIGGGLPVNPVDVTREITSQLTASFNNKDDAKRVGECLKANDLVQER